MRTTLTLDDDVAELAVRLAKARRVSLGKAVSDRARRGLNDYVSVARDASALHAS